MTYQPPEVLLNQLSTNLLSSLETDIMVEHSSIVRVLLATKGFRLLVDDMNEVRKQIGNGQLFTEDDFKGATIFPDEDYIRFHTEKHTLPPLSFGVNIPEDKWNDLAVKLNLNIGSMGQSIYPQFFPNSTLGLNKSGITFHIDRGKISDIELELLYNDNTLYSRNHPIAQEMKAERLVDQNLAILIMEHLTLSSLVSGRSYSPEDLTVKLVNRCYSLVENIPYWLGIKKDQIEPGKKAYRTIFQPSIDEIYDAVKATFELDKMIGPGLVTPFLFSLGSTVDELKGNHLLSPLTGIKNLHTYVLSCKITEYQIIEILNKKEYDVQSLYLHSDK